MGRVRAFPSAAANSQAFGKPPTIFFIFSFLEQDGYRCWLYALAVGLDFGRFWLAPGGSRCSVPTALRAMEVPVCSAPR